MFKRIIHGFLLNYLSSKRFTNDASPKLHEEEKPHSEIISIIELYCKICKHAGSSKKSLISHVTTLGTSSSDCRDIAGFRSLKVTQHVRLHPKLERPIFFCSINIFTSQKEIWVNFLSLDMK